MGFDLATAKPATSGGFDLKTAKPATAQGQQDTPSTITSFGAGLGAEFGKIVLGAQGLVGKGLQKVGEAVAPDQQSIAGLVRGKKDRGMIQSAGDWLVNDAEAGRNKLAGELTPYKDAHPFATGAGQVGTDIIVTLPVGGLVASGMRAAAPALVRVGASAPVVQRLATAVETGGFRTGTPAATTLAGKAADMGVRAAGGAITGGASSAVVNPEEAGTGALIGAALPPALAGTGRVAGYAGNALKALAQPFTEAGQGAIAGNILAKIGAGGPMAVNAAELVPGSRPTLAEATGNAGIAGLQRVARDLRPNAFAAREGENAAARTAAFDGIAGNNALMAAAGAARDDAAGALYGQAFTADAMRRNLAQGAQQMRAPFSGVGLSGAADDLATPGLRELASRPMFKQAVDDAKRLAANKGVKLDDPLQSLEGLHYVKLALDDALNPTAKTAMGRNASGAVMDMRDRLAAELAEVSPLYGNARQTFAEMSQPINAMESLQGLRLTDARGNMTLAKVQNSIAALERARSAPGVDAAKSVSKEQLDTLYAIRDDLLRQDSLGAGRSVGSNTFQNIATNNLLSELLPGPLSALAQSKVGGVLGQAGRLIYSGPNEAIRNRLVDLMLDPAMAQSALGPQPAGLVQKTVKRINPLVEAAGPSVYRAAPVVGSSSRARDK
jgi:hypothetical protein